MLSPGNIAAVIPSKAEAQVLAARLRGTLVLSLGVTKGYYVTESLYHVFLPFVDPRLCICELIDSNAARFAMDIDEDIEARIPEVEGFLVHRFSEVHRARVRVTWIYSDAPSGNERRWHCIVAGAAFRDLWVQGCMATVEALRQRFPWFTCDQGLYRNGASLRMAGQLKLTNTGYARQLRVYRSTKISDLVVAAASDDVPIVASQLETRERSVSPPRSHVHWPRTEHEQPVTREHVAELLRRVVPRGLVLGRPVHTANGMTTYRLECVAPWHCVQCDRVHQRDNAYLRTGRYGTSVHCYKQRRSSATS